MKTYGGSEFDEKDFLLFGEAIKELTYYTYLVEVIGDKAPGYMDNKDKLTEYKTYMRNELLEHYNKGNKFNELNDMVVTVAKDEGYKEVAGMGDDMLYDFTGLTEKILKKIGINYVLTQDDLDSIRNVLESSSSRAASRTSSRSSRAPSRTSSSSSRGRTKKKKSTKKKKKKTKGKKKKKKPTKKKHTKLR